MSKRATRSVGSCLKRARDEIEKEAPVLLGALGDGVHKGGLTLAFKAAMHIMQGEAKLLGIEVPAEFENELYQLGMKFKLLQDAEEKKE